LFRNQKNGSRMCFHHLRPWLTLTLMVCALALQCSVGAEEPTLNRQQMEQFLLNAKVVNSTQTKKGVTNPWRLTLSDGTLTHDALFQAIDETKPLMRFASGSTEMNFKDSYKYNIAGFLLAELLGLDDIVPVTVERKWHGNSGSLSWWVPFVMDEADRHKQKLRAPDPDAWNKQMYKIRVFDQLLYDADPNLTNVLIGKDWQLWRVDFSRAFRQYKDLQDPKDLERCDRQLLERLKALDANELATKTKGYLTKSEVQGLMARRDKIVAYFQKLIAEKGESGVLY
jgi:hypothetical protein